MQLLEMGNLEIKIITIRKVKNFTSWNKTNVFKKYLYFFILKMTHC